MQPHRTLPCGKIIPSHQTKFGACMSIDLMSRLRGYLQDRGLRMTSQRQRIVNYLIAHSQHKTAPEIAQKISTIDATIGTATVFRSLNLLCDAGILARNRLPITGDVVYEIKENSEEIHNHIICMDCNEIFEFEDSALFKQSRQVVNAEGFNFVEKPIVLYGKCKELQRPKPSKA
ncbi:MAG TPA: Fur family transcriptional regulator [Bdellovibrionota bacterium]|jgi:Fur family ferric uptake transcriptional regulator|nr:Fur family transcriptional regulator [Bdellovibrionota bacterium]